ncbi:hypothetical protein Anas_12409 [Armadillidium nasatum]|uniref:Uncharacterized protein n=1 Tax=Armadillidium nasatum TaxID=96803 RepID=A0A5N5T6K3_9CRUS|nr:hypothetical protein Anas_12409 [Armadillidium nasatum]
MNTKYILFKENSLLYSLNSNIKLLKIEEKKYVDYQMILSDITIERSEICLKPQLISQAKLKDLVRDLNLTKTQTEVLVSRLNEWNHLESDVNIANIHKQNGGRKRHIWSSSSKVFKGSEILEKARRYLKKKLELSLNEKVHLHLKLLQFLQKLNDLMKQLADAFQSTDSNERKLKN